MWNIVQNYLGDVISFFLFGIVCAYSVKAVLLCLTVSAYIMKNSSSLLILTSLVSAIVLDHNRAKSDLIHFLGKASVLLM